MRFIPIAALACCQMSLSGCASVAAVAAAHPAAIAAVIDILPVAAVLGGIGRVGIAGIAGEQPESHAPGTLGAWLKERQTTSESGASGAMAAQREVSVTAALQAQRAIARARIALRDRLAARVETLDAGTRETLSEIDAAIATLPAAEPRVAKQAGDRIQLVADKLAVPAQVPQVRSFGPVYLFPFLPFQTLTVRGNFPAQYPEGEVPKLTVNGRVFKAYTYDAQSLGFSLPADSLVQAAQGVAWSRAELEIPWEAPRFDTFARQGFGNFVVIGMLPNSPGRVTIDHQVEITRSEEVARTSEALTLNADAGESEQTACLTLKPAELAAGWKLKAGSVAPVFAAQSGGALKDHGKKSEDERSVCWRVELNAAERLVWRLTAVLRRDLRESRTESESLDLAWGGSRVFNFPAGSWKVRYAKFEGAEVVFGETDLSSPLFRVEGNARSVKVIAYPF